jgi:glycerate 2-kinase
VQRSCIAVAENLVMPAPRQVLLDLFQQAIAAVDPLNLVARYLPAPPEIGRTVVIGAGKAAARMAQGVEQHWQGELSGLVVTRYGHGAPTQRIEVIEAGHPVPDEASAQAAERMLALVHGLTADDLVICLISGGGSALLSLPAPGITAEEKRELTRALLKSGAPIGEMNCVRRHLSAIKGGRLAAAAFPARVVTYAISDVPGDDPAVIGSGPTVADPTTFAEARRIFTRYAMNLPAAIASYVHRSTDETPKPGDPRLAHVAYELIATPREALEAAAKAAREAGLTPIILGDAIEGEAREVAKQQAARARQSAPGTVLLSGGETTVTVRGKGRGGRNTEFLLALALALNGAPGIHALAADTDGTDGTEDNAGAFIGPDTLARARFKGLDPVALLADNDAWSAFAALDDLLVTGPTFTNVNDFRAILITGED